MAIVGPSPGQALWKLREGSLLALMPMLMRWVTSSSLDPGPGCSSGAKLPAPVIVRGHCWPPASPTLLHHLYQVQFGSAQICMHTLSKVKSQIIIHNQVFIRVSVVYYLFCSSTSGSVTMSAAECSRGSTAPPSASMRGAILNMYQYP